MTDFDFTRAIKDISPDDDGPSKLSLRTGVIAAVNGGGTVDVTLADGSTVANKPVVGSSVVFSVGQVVNILTGRGQFLVLGGTASSGATTGFPSSYVTIGTPTLTTGVITDLTPATIPYNIGGMYPGSGINFTVPAGQGGLYQAAIVLRYASQASPAGTRQARVNKNGAEFILFNQPAVTNYASSNIVVSGAIRIPMSAGDTVSFGGYQNSGGNLAIMGNSVAWFERVR